MGGRPPSGQQPSHSSLSLAGCDNVGCPDGTYCGDDHGTESAFRPVVPAPGAPRHTHRVHGTGHHTVHYSQHNGSYAHAQTGGWQQQLGQ